MFLQAFVMFISFHGFASYRQFQSDMYEPLYRRYQPSLNMTYFYRLENYHVNARSVAESDYPWIARVVHSRDNVVPYLCTASCVAKCIFITNARCTYVLKIKFTSLLYKNKRLTVKALVTPSQESKQLYDDIGFIVVNGAAVDGWSTVNVFNKSRTGKGFDWFNAMNLDKNEYKVVGYARKKESRTYPLWHHKFELTELNVIMNMNLCADIKPYAQDTAVFNVPCYHSCSVGSFLNDDITCKNYHGVEGGAVMNTKSGELMALATWGFFTSDFEFPVGVAMANSDNFFEDYICAKKIRDNKDKPATPGYYQSLCNG